ncbi:MAG: hybrid sensor histidine kinase/response regulator [Candidatus Tectomicrobia bacterium]|uniref:histidine kinase n=1 Tax=Tectimicrobiota bacterium TaxID=2528274 RepID=A0A932CNN9_UNCTE|nr:hybrid sensor histidine kinase/response regulator [Candidatus Tectomicrobia bacterium]
MSKEDEFLKRLLSTFQIEAEEHLQAISSGLIELEGPLPPERQAEIVETIFREAHSLKGAACAVNLADMEAICQALEDLLAALKRQERPRSPELLDLLHQTVGTLGQILRSTGAERASSEAFRITELIQRLREALKGEPLPPLLQERIESPGALLPEKPSATDTVRISTARLDRVLLQAEEMLSARQAASQRALDLREVNVALGAWEEAWIKVQPEIRQARRLLQRENGRNAPGQPSSPSARLLEFLDWNAVYLRSLESRLAALTRSAEQDDHALGRMVGDLLEEMKKVLMLPFSSYLEILPKLARDLSHAQGKKVALVIQGGEIEIDRRILEEIKAPLIHLVRNCIDHGIERPEERARKRKPPQGAVTVAISQREGGKVEVLVSDDGAGIDPAKVRATALRLGTISPEEATGLNPSEVLSLIFQSGFSTSPIVTDVSGRGLGLAILREKVEKLGGTVSLETTPDLGTVFRMVVPLTLATFRGVLVRVNEQFFVIPTIQVERVIRVRPEEIKTVENRETIPLDGRATSLVRLGEVLGIPPKGVPNGSETHLPGIVLGTLERCIAFLVDEILDEQEVLVKTLGRQLSRVRNIAGATILGTGKVVPVLHLPDLMKSAVRSSAVVERPATVSPDGKEAERKSILVVEDSITSRTLIKNILEMAGYEVTTAVDGSDGLTQLRSREFDLVISDVDMPIMNGFDLTARIRSDKGLSDLPVILVTALGSREDMERGVEVGANAYIVKSRFDQNNLLEAIRRFL